MDVLRCRPAAGDEFEQHHADTVEIASRTDRLTTKAFGRHVGRRAHQTAGLGEVRAVDAGDPEVGHLHAALVRQNDVGRLDVPVHDAARVGITQRLEHFPHDIEAFRITQPFPPLQEEAQLLALHVFHDDVVATFVIAHVVHGHDVRVLAAGRGPRLAPEAVSHLVGMPVRQDVRMQDLDGHLPVDDRIVAQIDLPHGTLPQQGAHLVFAESGGRLDHQRPGFMVSPMSCIALPRLRCIRLKERASEAISSSPRAGSSSPSCASPVLTRSA